MANEPQHIECIARGVTIRADRVLLCRSLDGGYSYLPGGHIEPGETAAEAVAREYLEECGLGVQVGRFLFAGEQLFDQPNRKGVLKRRHEITVHFEVALPPSDEPFAAVPSLESDIAFDWVPLAAIVDTDVRPASARAWLVAGGRIELEQPWISEDHRGT